MLSTTLSIQGMQTKNSLCPPEMGGLWVDLPIAYNGVSDNLHTRLIGKDSDAGRDWGQEEKAGWHH